MTVGSPPRQIRALPDTFSLAGQVAVGATTERAHERAAELVAGGAASIGVVADLTDKAEARRAVAEVVAALGRPTILVNNAGMTSVAAPALSTPSVDAGASTDQAPEAGSSSSTPHTRLCSSPSS
jgi:3-oxoacyl-[acyl-carrier protein] reductase